MKTKLVAMAGGLACVFATTAMPIHAEEIYTAISGSSVALWENAGAIVHSVAIPLKKNGKKFNKDGTTIISRQLTYPVGGCTSKKGDPGFQLGYAYADSVSTLPNGDLVIGELGTDRDSTLCATADYFEVTLYTKITGGTGEFEGACGSQTTTLTGKYLTSGGIFSIEGTGVGEILRSADCPL